MKLPTDQTKKTAQFRFVEVAKFVPSLDRIIREKKDGLPVLVDVNQIQAYAAKNQFKGIFQSVFQYDSQHLDSAASIGPLFFDIDSNEIAVSKDETTRLVNYLLSYFSESAVRVYFSGQKGFHIECHPGDQEVLTSRHGYIKIKDLDESIHQLVPYNKNRDRIIGLNTSRGGVAFSRSSRVYNGQMLTFDVEGKIFRCTPNHHLTVSWSNKAKDAWAVYLMRKDLHWRIGVTKLFASKGSSRIKIRMSEEGADAIWILGVFNSESQALTHKTLWSSKFEELETNTKIDSLFSFFGLDKSLPFRAKTDQSVLDSDPDPITKRFKITAINFIPGYMEIPINVGTQKPKWTSNVQVSSSDFHGEVFNIAMETYHHYIASGAIVHNCEPVALALGPSGDLPGIFRFIARYISDKLGLQGTDFNVYDSRRMWRVPNTIHQRTGLYKVECMQLLRDSQDIAAILELAKAPREVEVPEQVHESKAIKWFGELKGEYEEQTFKAKSYYSNFDNFLRGGTNYHSNDMGSRVFTTEILDKCSAVKSMYDKVRTEHYLNHYERLFLCSLFTYNEQAVEFLHKEILSHCEDYNFQISDNHIKDWIRRRENGRGGRPFTCEKAQEVGIICQDCDKLKPAKRRINGHIMDEEVSPSPVRLAYIDITRKELYERR